MADDGELLEQIRRGDTAAFDLFYSENAPRLLRFLRQLIGTPQAAEDVTHETFLQLWRRPNGFRPESGSLRAYLFGIARKRAAEWWRQRKPEEDASSDDLDVASSSHCTEANTVVGDAFSRLDREQRALLWLREVEGQSYAELAKILEIPIGTVRSRLFAAREELRRIWHGAPREPQETDKVKMMERIEKTAKQGGPLR